MGSENPGEKKRKRSIGSVVPLWLFDGTYSVWKKKNESVLSHVFRNVWIVVCTNTTIAGFSSFRAHCWPLSYIIQYKYRVIASHYGQTLPRLVHQVSTTATKFIQFSCNAVTTAFRNHCWLPAVLCWLFCDASIQQCILMRQSSCSMCYDLSLILCFTFWAVLLLLSANGIKINK